MAVPTPLIFGGSVVLALLLLWRGGSLGDVGNVARRTEAGTVVAALTLYLAGLALLAYRWYVLVRMTKGSSAVFQAAEAFLTSVVINYAAPIGLAVPARAALTKRALGLTAGETGALAIWEVAVDVLVLGMASLLWLLTVDDARAAVAAVGGGRWWAVGLAVVVGIAVCAVAAVLAWRRPGFRRRIVETGTGLARGPRQRPRDATLAVGVTVVYWVIQGIVLGMLLDAVGLAAGAGFVLGLTSLPVLIGMLSPVPGGAGVREALMVAVAQARDVDAAATLVAALTYRVALFVAIPILYAATRIALAVTARRG